MNTHLYATLVLLLFCQLVQAQEQRPGKFRLPDSVEEASGLVYSGADSLWWHNDSGDGPVLYVTDLKGNLLRRDSLAGIRAIDWEDMTSDRAGTLYIGDVGNNRGLRTYFQIYRYRLSDGQLDSILFRYPGQDGSGRQAPGNLDTEGFFFYRDSLHFFTKDLLNEPPFTTYHYVIPAQTGTHVAELRDSLNLKKRVVTAATIDPQTGEVFFTAYFFRMGMGFIPRSSASVYMLADYPEGHFFRGTLRRKGIACLFPTQYEAIDIGPAETVLVGTERTKANRQKAKSVRIRSIRRKRIRNKKSSAATRGGLGD